MVIELIGIEKVFNSKTNVQHIKVLKGINLSVKHGEMVAIKGQSGAGKSTLLHILGCLDKPSSGIYRLDGEDISKKPLSELAAIRNKHIGFVMQHFALIEDDTVIQNVGIPLLFGGTPFHEIDAIALKQLEALGVDHLANQTVCKLSGGEKQRVAIARSIVNNPDVLLADEPTGSLDTKNSEMVMDLFRKINNQGKTIIIVTHDDYVANLCSRVVTISDGMIV